MPRGLSKKSSGRVSFRRQQEALLDKIRFLEQQQAAVLEAHAALCGRERILALWIDSLELLDDTTTARGGQQQPQQQQPWQQIAGRHSQPQGDAETFEATSAPSSAGPSASAAAAAAGGSGGGCHAVDVQHDPLQELVGSLDDPLAFFRNLASQPLVEGVEDMTALQHLQQHRQLAMELGIQLHLLEHPSQAQAAHATIKKLISRHYHIMWSLVCCGRLDIIESTKVFNLETQELLSNTTDAALFQRHHELNIMAELLPVLRLSRAQEDATAYAVEVCEALMAPIAQEMQQLQKALDACVRKSSKGFCPDSSSGGSGSSDGNGDGAGGKFEGPTPARQALLQEQQKLLERVQVVMRKQYHVATANLTIFLSCLTWVQAARMIVHRWPYAACMQFTVKAVWRHRQERLQRQHPLMMGSAPAAHTGSGVDPWPGAAAAAGIGSGAAAGGSSSLATASVLVEGQSVLSQSALGQSMLLQVLQQQQQQQQQEHAGEQLEEQEKQQWL